MAGRADTLSTRMHSTEFDPSAEAGLFELDTPKGARLTYNQGMYWPACNIELRLPRYLSSLNGLELRRRRLRVGAPVRTAEPIRLLGFSSTRPA